MKTVLTYGSYDLLHIGHVNILRRAKELGDYLIVGLSTEEFEALKNKKSYYSYEERKVILEAIKYVNLVIPERTWEQKLEDVKKYGVSILVMGNDWEGKFDSLRQYCDVVYLSRTENVSTTETKRALRTCP